MHITDVVTAPWAILPEKLLEIQAVYATHLRGEKIDIAAIEVRLGKPLINQYHGYHVQDGVAIIPISGVMGKKMNMMSQISGGASTQLIERDIKAALNDSSVNSILLNWAVVSVHSRRGLKTTSASLFVFYMMLFGWLFTSLLFFGDGLYVELPALTLNGWLGVTFLGIFCSGLAYIAWYDALPALTTASTGAFLYIEPLIAMVVAFFVLGEAITLASLAGGGVILLGVWLVNKS